MKIAENKHIIIILFSVFMIILLAVSCYYLYLMPLSTKVDAKKMELELAQQEASILETKIKSSQEKVAESSIELQKQVPVKRLLEQALLEIEKAEIISGANLIELTVNGTASDEDVTNEELTTADKAIKDANAEDGDSADQMAVENEISLPNGIKKTSITIIGEAETYYELEKLIETLQSSNRIIDIESLDVTGTKEIVSVEDNDQKIEFEMSLSIYYFPKLTDLVNELPPLESPKTSDKLNPFASASIKEDGDIDNP
ncbi:pilus assembly protein PilO [Niallia sp. NCCP-28]|uniref:pilus assembly protein PilO n=1 Tax=Niallia sp. NCCP-28 TaxID=2934712 RepID=UPI00207F937F|nr:pilus assembly protein PilO [Niallia sp. NCCP-28]GKU81441.1 hypothetical protein NCCP28_08370 [Niallia sp. NCCP-28]